MVKNQMFPLEVSMIDRYAMGASCDDETTLWHLHYGHLNINGLKLLSRKEIVLDYRNLIISVFVRVVFMGSKEKTFVLKERLGGLLNVLN